MNGALTPSTVFVIVLFLLIFVGIGVGLVRYAFGRTGRSSGVDPHTGRSTAASE